MLILGIYVVLNRRVCLPISEKPFPLLNLRMSVGLPLFPMHSPPPIHRNGTITIPHYCGELTKKFKEMFLHLQPMSRCKNAITTRCFNITSHISTSQEISNMPIWFRGESGVTFHAFRLMEHYVVLRRRSCAQFDKPPRVPRKFPLKCHTDNSTSSCEINVDPEKIARIIVGIVQEITSSRLGTNRI